MDSTSSADVMGPFFYGHVALGSAIIGAWFYKRATPATKGFGVGLLGFALAFAIWTAANIAEPSEDTLKVWMTIGAAPFLLSALAFARVGWRAYGKETQNIGMVVALIAVVGTFVMRTFVKQSQPHFNADGWLYLGVDPAAAACYIATLTLTLLPAINVVCQEFDNVFTKRVLQVCLSTLFVNAIVVFASRDNSLIEINSVVATVMLAALWVTCLVGFKSKESTTPRSTTA